MRYFRLTICVALAVYIGITSANAQDKALKKQLKGFDQFVEEELKKWNVPGVALGIVKDGELVYAKGYGYRDLENKLPVTEKTVFAIGSSTKTLAAAAVLKLADEGKLDIDKPIRDYLPDFRMSDDYVGAHLTPRDLLCHRSGLPRHDMVWYASGLSNAEMMKRLEYLEPSMDLREGWQYQNLMFGLASYLVEKVSGQTWESYIEEHFFNPMGMTSSNFSVFDTQKGEDYAFPYMYKDGSVTRMNFRDISNIQGAGSINSNVVDMSKWLITQMNDGVYKDQKILSKSSIQQSHTPHMPVPGGKEFDVTFYNSYGLGWFINVYRGQVHVSHGGNIDGFSANIAMLPEQNLGVVLLTDANGTNLPYLLTNKIFDRFLGAEKIDWSSRFMEKQKRQDAYFKQLQEVGDGIEGTSPSHPLEDYAGTYEHPGYGKLKLTLADGKLVFNYNAFKDVPVEHHHYSTFNAVGGGDLGEVPLTFHANGEGEIDVVSAPFEPTLADIRFERIEELASPASIDDYVGKYEAGGKVMEIFKEGKVLRLRIANQPLHTLVPRGDSVFGLQGGGDQYKLTFKRDNKGNVDRFISEQPNGVFVIKKQEEEKE